jgi:hypothetical protein
VIANRAAELILQKERLDWKAQADRDLMEVKRQHGYDLAGERQKRINTKANMKNLDFSNFRDVERQLKEVSERVAECVPKLEEIVNLQCIQAMPTKMPPRGVPRRRLVPRRHRARSRYPQRQAAIADEVYRGGKTGGKGSAKSPKEKYAQADRRNEERKVQESEEDQGLYSPK